MKNNLLLIILFLLSINAISQNKKFSIDINYPLSLSNGEFDKISGIIDGSLKYRFKETDLLEFGISYTFDLLKGKISPFVNEPDLNKNFIFHHLDVFSELNLNSTDRFHPFFGLGYTMLNYDYEYFYGNNEFTEIRTKKENDSGINFNLGLKYDISDMFFVQTYFHYIRTFRKSVISDKNIGINNNQLKFGLGYRF